MEKVGTKVGNTDALMQDCGISSASALEIPQSYTNKLIWKNKSHWFLNLHEELGKTEG